MEAKVHILLATYNGAAYINDQIDSLLNQTYSNIEIFVLDDGSCDDTMEKLMEYQKKGLINIVKNDSNLGYPYSFFKLLKECKGADYYCFSDQDDIWYPEKVERAVEVLNKADNKKEQVYFSAFEYADGDMNVISRSVDPPEKIEFIDTFFQCFLWGFSTVINEKMRLRYVNKLPEVTKAKDYWLHMLGGAFGEFHYDSRISARHRRHGNNHSQDPTSFIKFQMWRFQYFFKQNQFAQYHAMLQEFYRYYKKELCLDDRKKLWLFQSDGHVMQKLCYPRRLRAKLIDEVLLRMAFVLRKL